MADTTDATSAPAPAARTAALAATAMGEEKVPAGITAVSRDLTPEETNLIAAVRAAFQGDTRASVAIDDAAILRFGLRNGMTDTESCIAMLRKCLYMREAILAEQITLRAARSAAESGFVSILDRVTSNGDPIIVIKWSRYFPKQMTLTDQIVVLVSYFEEGLRRLNGRIDGRLVCVLDYKDWKLAQSDTPASKVLMKILESLYCNVMRGIYMVHCGMFARGLIKLFKTFSSKSIMSRVHVCARLETALSHAGIRQEDLPPELGGSSDFDMSASIATLCDADARELPAGGHQVRDDFAHFHSIRPKMKKEAVMSQLEAAAEGTAFHMTFRRTAGMFGSIHEYDYILIGPVLYTWPSSNSTVHKIMEPQAVFAEPAKADQFPFAVQGHLGDGSFETWTPIASSAEERDEAMGRISRAIASLRTGAAAAAVAAGDAPVAAKEIDVASKE